MLAKCAGILSPVLLLLLTFGGLGLMLAAAAPPPPGDLVLYDNGVGSGFWDGSYTYSSRNPCDASTYTSAGCSYAIAYDAWGALNFGKEGGFATAGYGALEFTINTAGQPLTNFGVVLGAYPLGLPIKQLTLAPSHVVATLPAGWVRVSVPVSQLNPDNLAVYTVQINNVTGGSLPTIYVDEARFVAAGAAAPSPTATGSEHSPVGNGIRRVSA